MPKRFSKTESSLMIPAPEVWLPSDPWRQRSLIDSRRMMSRRRCCCDCTIFADDFTADDLAANWTQQAGMWAIGSGVLSTSSSNAVLTCNTSYPGGGFHAHVIEVSLKASTGNRSRIIFDYNSGLFTCAEIYWNDASSVVYIKTSSGSTLATSSNMIFTNGSWYTFRVCVVTNSVAINSVSGVTLTPIVGASISPTYTMCGLGTAATSAALEFDDFSFEKHNLEDATCKSCGINCNSCSAPEEFLVKLDALQNSGCTNCTSFGGGGGYVVIFDAPSIALGSCVYGFNYLNYALCEFSIEAFFQFITGQYRWQVNFRIGGGGEGNQLASYLTDLVSLSNCTAMLAWLNQTQTVSLHAITGPSRCTGWPSTITIEPMP